MGLVYCAKCSIIGLDWKTMVVIQTFEDADGNKKGVTTGTPLPVTDSAVAVSAANIDSNLAAILELNRQTSETVRQLTFLNAQIKEAFETHIEIEDI